MPGVARGIEKIIRFYSLCQPRDVVPIQPIWFSRLVSLKANILYIYTYVSEELSYRLDIYNILKLKVAVY